jgi:HEAT repeat protein
VFAAGFAVLATCVAAQDATALAERLNDSDAGVRASAACELDRLGSAAAPAIPALVRLLSDAVPVRGDICGGERGWRTRFGPRAETTPGERAAAALASVGTAAFESLRSAAGHAHWVARKNAVWALGALEDARGVRALVAALADSEAPVRRNAAWALGAVESKESVPALVAALRDSDEQVRAQAAWALGAIESAEAVEGLMRALASDSDADVRSQAAWALGAIGDARATGALSGALKDSSADVRRQAAWALGAVRE